MSWAERAWPCQGEATWQEACLEQTVRIVARRGDAHRWEALNQIRVHGLVAEQALGVLCNQGRMVFEALASTTPPLSLGLPRARVGPTSEDDVPLRLRVPQRVWASAFASAACAWRMIATAGLRLVAGPQRVRGATSAVEAGVDGLAEPLGGDPSSVVLELQTVLGCTVLDLLSKKMAEKAEVAASAAALARAEPGLQDLPALGRAKRILVVTVEVTPPPSCFPPAENCPRDCPSIRITSHERAAKKSHKTGVRGEAKHGAFLEVTLGGDIEPKASAELREHDGRGVLRRWIRGVEEDLAAAAAVAARQEAARAATKRARGEEAERAAAKKARKENQAAALREVGMVGMQVIDRLPAFDGTVAIREYLEWRRGETVVRSDPKGALERLRAGWGWPPLPPKDTERVPLPAGAAGLWKAPGGSSFGAGTPWVCNKAALVDAHKREHGL
jgi:hypothetical protein